MMAFRYDDKRIILALQIDHSRVAGFFAAHWGNEDFGRPSPLRLSCLGRGGARQRCWWEWEMCPSTLNDKGYPLDHDAKLNAASAKKAFD